MPESFDAYQYVTYLRHHWRFAASVCLIASGVALGVSLLLPDKYTATARIVIDPPAGSDVRASIAVSPIYLESLRTYELFASSDSLFQRALEKFQLRRQFGGRPIESLKRSVLKVEIPRNTKILEISATLPDPGKAQKLAMYIAEETVALNQNVNREGDQELTAEAQKDYTEARARLKTLEDAWNEQSTRKPVADLQDQIDTAERLRYDLQQQLSTLQVSIAQDEGRAAALASAKDGNGNSRTELGQITASLQSGRAGAENLRKQIAAIEAGLAKARSELARRTARRDLLEAQLHTSRTQAEALDKRLQELRGTQGFRGERLKIIDPGIVPERPSSPNLPLNVVAAFLAALVLSGFYLSFRFGLQNQRSESLRRAWRVSGKPTAAGNDG